MYSWASDQLTIIRQPFMCIPLLLGKHCFNTGYCILLRVSYREVGKEDVPPSNISSPSKGIYTCNNIILHVIIIKLQNHGIKGINDRQ